MSSYREFTPRPELNDVVACTWTRAAPASAVADELRILPDGCVDLVWSGSELLVASPDPRHAQPPRTPRRRVHRSEIPRRVLRFRRFLTSVEDAAAGRRDATLASLAWDLGYADQAHLARECRELSGLTPHELAAWWTAPG